MNATKLAQLNETLRPRLDTARQMRPPLFRLQPLTTKLPISIEIAQVPHVFDAPKFNSLWFRAYLEICDGGRRCGVGKWRGCRLDNYDSLASQSGQE
jgi:hypothetical protein